MSCAPVCLTGVSTVVRRIGLLYLKYDVDASEPEQAGAGMLHAAANEHLPVDPKPNRTCSCLCVCVCSTPGRTVPMLSALPEQYVVSFTMGTE
jgi:hypothetical protein